MNNTDPKWKMSEKKGAKMHTNEPWRMNGPSDGRWDKKGDYAILDEAGKIIGEFFQTVNYNDERPARENAERAISCVNILADLNPDAIKGLVEAAENALMRLRDITSDHGVPSRHTITTLDQALKNLREIKCQSQR